MLFDDSTHYNPGDLRAEQLLRQLITDDLVAETPLMLKEDSDDDYIEYAKTLRIINKLNTNKLKQPIINKGDIKDLGLLQQLKDRA